MLPDIYFEKTMVVLSNHITKKEFDGLKRDFEVSGSNSFICFPIDESIVDEMGPSQELWNIIDIAEENHCTHLKFISNGPILNGFELFDW